MHEPVTRVAVCIARLQENPLIHCHEHPLPVPPATLCKTLRLPLSSKAAGYRSLIENWTVSANKKILDLDGRGDYNRRRRFFLQRSQLMKIAATSSLIGII